MEEEKYHFYIWFKVPKFDKINIIDDGTDVVSSFLNSMISETANMINIVGFSFPADRLKPILLENPKKILENIFQLFLPTTKQTLKWIIELQQVNPFLKIVPGDRIFIRELNQCWECTEEDWVLVDTKGTTV